MQKRKSTRPDNRVESRAECRAEVSRDSHESRSSYSDSRLYESEVEFKSSKRNYEFMTGPAFVPPTFTDNKRHKSSSDYERRDDRRDERKDDYRRGYERSDTRSRYNDTDRRDERRDDTKERSDRRDGDQRDDRRGKYDHKRDNKREEDQPKYTPSSPLLPLDPSILTPARSPSNPRSNEVSTSRKTLYRKEEHEEGKNLSKSQIKRSIQETDQSHSTFYNEVLPDDKIVAFVTDVLIRYGNVDPLLAKQLLDQDGIKMFRTAFTHWTVTFINKSELNFEVYETLGDVTFNKVIMFYIMRRFPQLMSDPEANYKLTEAQKLYKSRLLGYQFADELGLPAMVRWRNFKYGSNPQKTIEMDNKFKTDVFESFLGAVELIVDETVFPHAGYSVAYNILDTLLKDVDMTVDVALTKPATAKLKELMDRLRGVRIFYTQKDDTNDIIGMNVKLKFDNGIQTKSHGFIHEYELQSGYIKGKEQGEDRISTLALDWLEQECDKKW